MKCSLLSLSGMLGIIAGAMIVFGSLSANAYSIDIANPGATTVGVGDSVTIVMSGDFDAGTILWSASLGFDASLVSYNQAASSNFGGNGYALDTPVSGSDPTDRLNALGGGGGCETDGSGCGLWGSAPPNAVWINAMSSQGSPHGVTASGTGVEIASMTFTADAIGSATFDILFDSSVGSSILTDESGSPKYVLAATGSALIVHIVPEPTTALLVGLGLAGLAAGRRRA